MFLHPFVTFAFCLVVYVCHIIVHTNNSPFSILRFAADTAKLSSAEQLGAKQQISKDIITVPEEDTPWRRSGSLRTRQQQQQQPESPTKTRNIQDNCNHWFDVTLHSDGSSLTESPTSPEKKLAAATNSSSSSGYPTVPSTISTTNSSSSSSSNVASKAPQTPTAADQSEVILRRTQSFENDPQ